MSTAIYLEHFGDADLALLAQIHGDRGSDDLLAYLRANPDYLEVLLRDPTLFSALFGRGEHEALLHASPFLIFAVLIHRTADDLERVRFVEEWLGPGRRVPMFEVGGLRAFGAGALRRLFMAELLASYTKVASGSFWARTPHGWRRRRFSDLDPLRLAELLESVTASERPFVYRRLGDLALFLTGVFPDYAGQRFLSPLPRQRLRRIVARAHASRETLPDEPVWLLEELGRRSYLQAWEATEPVGGRRPDVLIEMAEGFGQARRLLNFLTDRYLFPIREQWFPV